MYDEFDNKENEDRYDPKQPSAEDELNHCGALAKRDIIGIVFVGASKSSDQKTDEKKTVSQQRGGDAKIKSPAVRRPQDDDGNLGAPQGRFGKM